MPKSINTLRRESQIRTLLAEIITNDLTNTNIINPTLVDCELSGDLSHVKIYMSFSENEKRGLEALQNASGYIRTILAKSLNWRKVPELHFYIDEVSKKCLSIDRILYDIKDEKNFEANNKISYNEHLTNFGNSKIFELDKYEPQIVLHTLNKKNELMKISYLKNEQNEKSSKAWYVLTTNNSSYGLFGLKNYKTDVLEKNCFKKINLKNRSFINFNNDFVHSAYTSDDELRLLEISVNTKKTEVKNFKDLNKINNENSSTSMNRYYKEDCIVFYNKKTRITLFNDNKEYIVKRKCLVFDCISETLYRANKGDELNFHKMLIIEKR
ncbi:Ribosome-binding factor A (plasmid) [Mesomycoplasma conjunctivae]|nr:30S ribosome-binding factor RbfA [Mycoplasmopsis fermentans]VEU60100.1 Ribosome-binding factor A [Mycoplasmopsis fermentans]VEU66892.1 Ribosome-binding factor A [Mesomycoplasma conjunctivae]